MTALYILLPVHNRAAITENFVRCLLAQTFRDFHLVLIDDGSRDGTAERVRELLPAATILRGDGNLWWAGSLQKGIDELKVRAIPDAAAVLIVNDDVTFEADFLAAGLAELHDHPRSLVLAKEFDAHTGQLRETGVAADLRRLTFEPAPDAAAINCLPTRGLFLRWGDIQEIGGFYPRILPHYLSDYEFTLRAHRKGFVCRTSDRATLRLQRENTGFRELPGLGKPGFLRRYFSNRSVANPIWLTTFVWLACPLAFRPRNWLRIWKSALSVTVTHIISTSFLGKSRKHVDGL